MNYKFELPSGSRKPIIKVIGVGGGGSNAVNYMYQQGIQDVEFIVCNTDVQALRLSPIEHKLQIGTMLTDGLGAGTNPEMGMRSAMEDKERIRESLQDTKMLFITAGMGGGTGTGAAPVIAKIAKEMDILTVGIVTMPFSFEGRKKVGLAEEGIAELKQYCDTVIVILNDKIREIYGNLNFKEAFSKADDILTVAAKSIAEIITKPGIMNIDFQDVNMVMNGAGSAVMGSSMFAGANKAVKAAEAALHSPLLNNTSISGAKKILVSITATTEGLSLDDYGIINDYLQDAAGHDALLKCGVSIDDNLGDNIRVTVIATGFDPIKVETEKVLEKTVIDLDSSKTMAKPKPFAQAPVINNTNQEPVFVPQNGIIDANERSRIEIDVRTRPNTPVPTSTLFSQEHEKAIVADYQKIDIDKKKKQQELQEIRITKLSETSVFSNMTPEEYRDRLEIPAYIRNKEKLYEQPHSSERTVSKFSLNEDGDVLGNNKFLHDNVD